MKKRLIGVLLCALLLITAGTVSAQQAVPVGEVVTVEGVAEIVSANAFRLARTAPFDVGVSNVVVFPDTAAGFGIDINSGIDVQVIGEIMAFDLATLQTILPYDLNTRALSVFGLADYALIASSVSDITETVVMDETIVFDIQDDPSPYYNQVVTVQGYADIMSSNVFRLQNTDPFDISPTNLLVMPNTAEGFAIDVNNGMLLQVTGTLQAFDISALEAELNYELDPLPLGPYDGAASAIVATSVIDLTHRAYYDDPTLANIESDPASFIGQTMTIGGVADIVSSRAFQIVDTLPFDLSPSRILVLPDTREGFWVDINDGLRVAVTGTLVRFDLPSLEARLGYDLNEIALADYGLQDYAIIATYINRID